MTARLSVNVNRIALLRNSRQNQLPYLLGAVEQCIAGGAEGITVHPRPDERHIRHQDVLDIAALLRARYPDIEYNVEGYPDARLLDLVEKTHPTQCTLVPDAPDQATSDHGWNVGEHEKLLEQSIGRIKKAGIRAALFMDPTVETIPAAAAVGADRIELYTEQYAIDWGTEDEAKTWQSYVDAAISARDSGLTVNAGHDLNLRNLPKMASLPGLMECSIGHAIACDALFIGLEESVRLYRQAIRGEVVLCDWYPDDYRDRQA